MEKEISKILIVDDEDFVRCFLNDCLESDDHDISLASNSQEAIDILQENTFDVILSDINLPGMSGVELLSFCKLRYKTTEVILITGNPELDCAIDSIKHGAFDYLSKPITPEKLNERVEAALKQSKEKQNMVTFTTNHEYAKNYKVLKVIGSGNAGTVFLVEKDQKQYAMKVLRQEDSNDPIQKNKTKRFIREAEILKQINHPNIVTIFDFGISEGDGSPYIIMELIEGKPLNTIIEEKTLIQSEKIQIIKQVAKALSVVHSLGVIHRDIKPANIILSRGNQVKLMDFGIAGMKDSNLTITHEVLGSPAYMPPESFDGRIKKDKRADIFSLGVIAYELFTGKRPFYGTSIGELIKNIEDLEPTEPIKMNPNIPDYINAIIVKMLQKDPNKRFSDTKDLVLQLDKAN